VKVPCPPRAGVAASRPRNPSASASSTGPGACARRRGARSDGVRVPLSTGVCVGAVPVEFAILERANVAASSTHRPQSPRNPSASDPSACPGACARHRGARPGGVRVPASIGPCVGALPVEFIILPRSCIAASRPHRRQSPPATPLRQPPQPAPAHARGAAGRCQAGCAHLPPSGHVVVPCPWRLLSCHAPTYLPDARTGVSPPPQPLCVSPLSLPRRVRAAPRGAGQAGCAHLSPLSDVKVPCPGARTKTRGNPDRGMRVPVPKSCGLPLGQCCCNAVGAAAGDVKVPCPWRLSSCHAPT